MTDPNTLTFPVPGTGGIGSVGGTVTVQVHNPDGRVSNLRTAHVDALVNLAVGNLYKGVDIDYRGLDRNLRGEYLQFLKELADKLHSQGKVLQVRVEHRVRDVVAHLVGVAFRHGFGRSAGTGKGLRPIPIASADQSQGKTCTSLVRLESGHELHQILVFVQFVAIFLL